MSHLDLYLTCESCHGLAKGWVTYENVSQATVWKSHCRLDPYLLLLLPLSALSLSLLFFLSLYLCQQLSHVVVFLLWESKGRLCHLQSTQYHVIRVTVCSSYDTLRNTRVEDWRVKRYAMHSKETLRHWQNFSNLTSTHHRDGFETKQSHLDCGCVLRQNLDPGIYANAIWHK